MRTILMPIIVAALTLFATPAMAAWDAAPKEGAWIPPVIAMLMAVLVVGSNMKNAKRGHQD